MAGHIVLDARKLGDLGIGVYIENLTYVLVELQRQERIDLTLTMLGPAALFGSRRTAGGAGIHGPDGRQGVFCAGACGQVFAKRVFYAGQAPAAVLNAGRSLSQPSLYAAFLPWSPECCHHP